MFEYFRNLIYTKKIVLTHVSFEPKLKIAKNPLNRLIFALEKVSGCLETISFFQNFFSQKFEPIKFEKKIFCLKSTEKVMFEYSCNLIFTKKIVSTHVSFEPKLKIAKNPLNRLIFARKMVSGCLETISFFRNFSSQKFEPIKFEKIFLPQIDRKCNV